MNVNCCVLSLLAMSSLPLLGQSNTRHVLCNEGGACAITDNGHLVSLSARDTGKYLRIDLTVMNRTGAPFAVLPGSIWAKEQDPKEKYLKPKSTEQMEHGLERRVAWANAFTGVAGAMARQQTTTYTTTSGTASAYGSDGSSAHGQYSGSSTSTTSVPDYAAQERANQQIAINQQRVANAEQYLEGVALKGTTLSAGTTVSGALYFERVKKGVVQICVPIDGTAYEFSVGVRK
jgi:hypothetical protein